MVTSSRAIRAARAFVELELRDNVQKGLSRLRRRLLGFGAAIGRIGAALTGFGALLSAPFVDAIKQASDAFESLQKFGTVFGSLESEASSFAETLASEVNRSVLDIKDSLAATAAAQLGLGATTKEALDFALAVEKASIDLGSFHNIQDDIIRQKVAATLSGQVKPMREFGILVNDSAVKAELLALGLENTDGALGELNKRQARFSLLTRQAGVALGDAIRTAASFENQSKGLLAAIKDIRIEIGNALLPIATKLITKFGVISRGALAFVKEQKGTVVVLAGIAAGITATGIALTVLAGGFIAAGLAISGVSAVFGVLATLISALTSPIAIVVAALAGLTAAWLSFTDDGKAAVESLVATFGDFRTQLMEVIRSITQSLGRGDFRAAADVAMAGLNAAFVSATNNLEQIWNGLWDRMRQSLTDTLAGMRIAYDRFTDTFAKGLLDIAAGFSSMWDRIETRARNFFDIFKGLVTGVEEGITQRRDVRNAESRERQAANAARVADEKQIIDEMQRRREEAAGAALNAERRARQEAARKRAADADKELQDAQRRLDEALKAAAAKEEKFQKEQAEKLATAGSRAQQARGAVGGDRQVTGGFSASLAFRQVGSFNARIAEATEGTDENTRRIAAAMIGRGVFL